MQSNEQILAASAAIADSLPIEVRNPEPPVELRTPEPPVEARSPQPVVELRGPQPLVEFRNPQPLANPLVTEAQVESHRALVCTAYDRCLDFAVRNGWRGWTCRICPQFEVERNAQLERLRELTDALPSSRAA